MKENIAKSQMRRIWSFESVYCLDPRVSFPRKRESSLFKKPIAVKNKLHLILKYFIFIVKLFV